MSGWAPEELHGSDDEDELDNNEFDAPRDAIVFALDASGHMLDNGPPRSRSHSPTGEPDRKRRKTGGESSMLAALRAILALMKGKIITNPKDMVGIVVFNTRETKGIGGEEFQDIYVVQDALELGAEMIKNLKDIISNAEEDPTTLIDMFAPHDGPSVIGSAVHTCNQLLRSRAHKMATKRIYLVTDVEDPFPLTDESMDDARGRRYQAQTLAKDCAEMQYTITPFFVVQGDDATFDVSKFYAEFLQSHVEIDAEEVHKFLIREGPDTSHGWQHFLACSSVRPPPKRSAFSIPFMLSKDLEIGINGYNVIAEAKKSLPIKVDLQGESAREIKTQTVLTDADAGEPLDPKKHTRPYFAYGKSDDSGEKKIVMTEDETAELRTCGLEPGLRLLGFLDPDSIPVELFVKHSFFVYPDEKLYIGSTRLFASLLKVMEEKHVAGLGVLVPRKNSTPQHVLIMPQAEVRDEQDEQVDPPGINLIQLAYIDDIRAPGANFLKGTRPAARDTDPNAPHEDFDLAKRILGKLKYKGGYTPEAFDNPTLHRHYAVLEAVALQEEPPAVVDSAVPKYVNIRKRAGDMIKDLREMVETNPETRSSSSKRAADGKIVTSKRKRKDEGEEAEGPSEADVITKAKAGQLQKFKKDEMLAYLASAGADHKKSSAKGVLAENITAHLTEKGLLD